MIIADAKLARLMGQERFNGFGMTKVLQPHFGAPLPDPPPVEAPVEEEVGSVGT